MCRRFKTCSSRLKFRNLSLCFIDKSLIVGDLFFLACDLAFKTLSFNVGRSLLKRCFVVFDAGLLRVFDREHQCTRPTSITATTVIIDNATMEDYNEGFANFTGLHEAGHFCMHGEVYRRNPNQLSLYNGQPNWANAVCCRKTAMGYIHGGGVRSA